MGSFHVSQTMKNRCGGKIVLECIYICFHADFKPTSAYHVTAAHMRCKSGKNKAYQF